MTSLTTMLIRMMTVWKTTEWAWEWDITAWAWDTVAPMVLKSMLMLTWRCASAARVWDNIAWAWEWETTILTTITETKTATTTMRRKIPLTLSSCKRADNRCMTIDLALL